MLQTRNIEILLTLQIKYLFDNFRYLISKFWHYWVAIVQFGNRHLLIIASPHE